MLAYKRNKCIYVHISQILHILYISVFDMLIDCHIIVQLLVTLRTTNDPTRSSKHCLHLHILLLNICRNP